MSQLPKLIPLTLLSTILLVPVLTSVFHLISNSPPASASGYQAEKVSTNLDHPTFITIDPSGRLLVVENGNDPMVIRIELSGVWTRLTAPNTFGQALPITYISYLSGRIYVGHGGMVSIIKPDGNLDTIPKSSSLPSPAPAVGDTHPVSGLAQEFGISPVSYVSAPDGSTYLSDLGENGGPGTVWKVVKANTVTNLPPTNLIILITSLAMIITAAIIILRPIIKRSYLVLRIRKFGLRKMRALQLTNVSAWPALPARPVRPIRWM